MIFGAFAPKFVGERHGFPRRVVGQAQHDEIDVAHHLGARLAVLALRRIDALHIDGAHASQPFADFEAGRPSLAVDEDACRFQVVLSSSRRHLNRRSPSRCMMPSQIVSEQPTP